MYNPSVKRVQQPLRSQRRQIGASLAELLVGVALGLMVMTAAIGTLVLSRATAIGVNDQLEIQQQANMAMRIMSTNLRQTFSREVVADATTNATFFSAPLSYTPGAGTPIQAFARTNGNDDFGVVFADIGPLNALIVTERSTDCLGNHSGAITAVGNPVISRFSVTGTQLECQGFAGNRPQPLVNDVQRFRVLYLVSNNDDVLTTAQYFTHANLPTPLGRPTNNGIIGVEICLELASAPRAGFQAPPGNYTDCDGVAVNHDTRTRAIVRQAIRLRAMPIQ